MFAKLRSFVALIVCVAAARGVTGGEGSEDDGGRGRGNINSQHVLSPPEGAPNQDASGKLFLKRNPVRDMIQIHVANLDPATTYDVNVSRNGESELLGHITTLPADEEPAGDDGGDGGGDDGDGDDGDDDDDDSDDGAPGSGKLKLDTKRGDTLPLGAASVADLVGVTVSVADAEGNVVLETTVDEIRRPGGEGRGPVLLKFEADPLEGAQEVPPVETEASGAANIKLKADGSLIFDVEVSNIELVTQAHIHLGAAGENGPPVAFLFGLVEEGVTVEGLLAEGTLTDDDILANEERGFDGTVAALVEQMGAGNTYVNVHTVANPPGEIRGQIALRERGDSDDPDEGDDKSDGGDGGVVDEVPEPDFVVSGRHDATFLRGDATGDGHLDLSDAVRALMVLFRGAPQPYCLDVLDANDDGNVDLTDPVRVLGTLFRGRPALPPPSISPAFDPTADDLFCSEPSV